MADADALNICLRILVVADEESVRATLATCLESAGHTVARCCNVQDALDQAARQVFDLIFLDASLGAPNGLDFLPSLLAGHPWTKVVVIAADASLATAITALKFGATDYLPRAFTAAHVQLVTRKFIQWRRIDLKIDALQSARPESDPEADLQTENAQMRRALDTARQAADSNASVLICGEVGAGKAPIARAIHTWSKRSAAPFVAVSCNLKSADALDAELFGSSTNGSGAGAVPGRVELCEGGALCLEDVANCPASLQPKLHHFIRDKEYESQDDFRPRRANVRIIATTSINPEEAVQQRRLRPELLLALDIVRVEIPALRDRPEDIPMLARRYLAEFAGQNHRSIARFTPDAMAALLKYRWPGNRRELKNLVERAVILCDSGEIGLQHFPPNLLSGPASYGIGDLVTLETIENLHIRRVLESTGSIRSAAAVLGIGVSTMVRWMKRAKMATVAGDAGEMIPAGAGAMPPS